MIFSELKSFLESKMKLSHIYQPLLIKNLLECDGISTIRQMAINFLLKDESQILYYEKVLKNMPIKVLVKHNVITKEGNLIKLKIGNLDLKQKAELIKICEEKLYSYIAKRGISIWDYKLLDECVVPDYSRDRTLKEYIEGCPFCESVKASEKFIDGSYSSAIYSRFPVTEDHILVIPKRHVEDFFELKKFEVDSVFELIKISRKKLLKVDNSITGFNIGINLGKDAGQTVSHCHIHIIPRRKGEHPDPRGGVRGVIPDKMKYGN